METTSTTSEVPLEDLERSYVIADTVLYRDAARFVQDHCVETMPKTSQVQGLLQYGRSWSDLSAYVRHQATRDQHKDHEFYVALQRWLKAFEGRLESEFHLVPDGVTKKQKQELKQFYGGLLGREFVQHLVAELRYREAQR